MNQFIQLPVELRYGLLFLVGVLVGTQVNRGIYRLAFFRREIGPWSRPEKGSPPRVWSDFLPVFGWLGLAREAGVHGAGFWVRPLLIELATGLGFVALYAWEIEGGLLPNPLPAGVIPDPAMLPGMLHWQCASHLLLCSLMLVATFIDFDEQTIPDEITVTGVILGLALAAAVPVSLLPSMVFPRGSPGFLGTLLVSSPEPCPAWLAGPWGLVGGLACYWGWCAAIWPSLWTTRRGLVKAVQYLLASMVRYRGLWRYILLAVVGGAGITGVWWLGGAHWQALFTSLIGMAFGGGLIWGVRIVGGAALGREAMGFGDVTLMAMIGAFLGWQPALLTFFLAPFAALFIALAQWVLTRKHEIAFGPYLCLGATILIVRWQAIWHNWAQPIFGLGWMIPAIVLVCLVLMGVMLVALQYIKGRFSNP